MAWQAKDVVMAITLLSAATSSRAEPTGTTDPVGADSANPANIRQKTAAAPSLELLQFLGEWQPDNQHWLEQLQQLDQLSADPTSDTGGTP